MKHKKANPLPQKGKNTKPLSENRKNDNPLPDPKTDAQRPKRSRWQRILTLLCLLGFLMFFFPVFGGILDLANSSAMLGASVRIIRVLRMFFSSVEKYGGEEQQCSSPPRLQETIR